MLKFFKSQPKKKAIICVYPTQVLGEETYSGVVAFLTDKGIRSMYIGFSKRPITEKEFLEIYGPEHPKPGTVSTQNGITSVFTPLMPLKTAQEAIKFAKDDIIKKDKENISEDEIIVKEFKKEVDYHIYSYDLKRKENTPFRRY